MKLTTTPLVLIGLIGCVAMADARADEQGTGAGGATSGSSIGSNSEDPSNLIRSGIPERRAQRNSLFPASPLTWLHDETDRLKDVIYEATHIKLGLTFNHLFQWVSDTVPGEDDWGTTTDMDFVGSWEVLNRGEPSQGEFFFGIEGRWDYGTTGPQDLGFVSLASAGGTGNAFSSYTPTFILRNLYWEQGGPEAGWAYRVGKITPDAILATSQHITPVTTFLPNAGTGLFSSGYPDSGLGIVGAWHFNERLKVLGLVSDANADRFEFGDIDEGDFYKAFEIGAKLFPRTEKAGYSKFTIWHADENEIGAINAMTGESGWGMTVKLEQELSADGRAVGIVRWGRSWEESSLYKQQASVHFLYYNPGGAGGLQHDVIGVAGNWVDSVVSGTRDEYNIEVFYRFPLFPGVDTRLSYQSVINPAFADDVDHASVLSLGLRVVF